MSRYIFLFDLDSTVTGEEILPTVAKEVGLYDEMSALTEKTMRGEIPFKQSFLQRVELLKSIKVDKVQDIVADIKLNEKLISFIKEHKNRCYIVTGNLDIWISKLMGRIGMEQNIYCSKALAENGYLQNVFSIVDKDAIIKQMIVPFVAVGDGNNDADMIEHAEVGIGYGGVRSVAPAVIACATHVAYDENTLVNFLNKLT